MRRRLALLAALAPLAASANAQGGRLTERSETFEATYSRWSGGCSTNKIADVSCAMRLEARSASGESLGFIVFGQGDRSRFLIIATRSVADAPLVIKIDSVPISDGPVSCWTKNKFCSVVLSVDDTLLTRLFNGSALITEVQGEIKLRFPLSDFARSRRAIL